MSSDKFEKHDVDFHEVIRWGVIVAVVFGCSVWGLRFLFNRQQLHMGSQIKSLSDNPFQLEPTHLDSPVLQVDEGKDMQGLHDYEESLLQGHGWVDATNGIVQIPIQTAMEILVSRSRHAQRSATEIGKGTSTP